MDGSGRFIGPRALSAAVRACALALALVSASFARAAEPEVEFQTLDLAGRNVALWQPAIPGKLPLIVFSPGFGACNTDYEALTSALARAGYAVAAPDHADSSCTGSGAGTPEAPFDKPQAWSEHTYEKRGRDLGEVIDALKGDTELSARIDTGRIGLMGHSLGGYTVLALAGAMPSWKRDDVRAVVAAAPLMGPLLVKGRLENISASVMFQAATRDTGTTALIKQKGGGFDRTPHATYVEIRDATHFVWSDGAAPQAADIVEASVAFFDAALRDRAFVAPKGPGIAALKVK